MGKSDATTSDFMQIAAYNLHRGGMAVVGQPMRFAIPAGEAALHLVADPTASPK